jgi:NAD+ diphosphatase
VIPLCNLMPLHIVRCILHTAYMIIPQPFTNCPNCLKGVLEFGDNKRLRCSSCGWRYYHNNAAAVAVIIRAGSRILFTERNADPGRGLLDLPGGFIDPGENAEEAVIRECREEIGTEPADLRYMGSRPNVYEFAGTTYSTCDMFFEAVIPAGVNPADLNPDGVEVRRIHWITEGDIDLDRIAFGSVRSILGEFLSGAG